MKSLASILLAASFSAILGCTSTKSDPTRFSATLEKIDSPGLIPLSEVVRLADARATKVLKRVNQEQPAFAEAEGPFNLEDYDKAIKQGHHGDRPFISVTYEYRKPHGFLGHPAHFSVWVFRDNGELMFFGGM
jgi:hypothetical protein